MAVRMLGRSDSAPLLTDVVTAFTMDLHGVDCTGCVRMFVR